MNLTGKVGKVHIRDADFDGPFQLPGFLSVSFLQLQEVGQPLNSVNPGPTQVVSQRVA